MAKYFKTAFAKNGDRATVPDNTQVDGSVSFEQGYGIDYERDQETDPQAKDIGRESFNGLFHDMTEVIGDIQRTGVQPYMSEITYQQGSIVWFNKSAYISISDNNKTQPPSESWSKINDIATLQNKGIVQLTNIIDNSIDKAVTPKGVKDYIDESLPVGSTLLWMGDVAPKNWIFGRGQSFSSSEYPSLALVYPSLSVPDFRGVVARGFDNGRGFDQNRALGSYQEDATQKVMGNFAISGFDASIAVTPTGPFSIVQVGSVGFQGNNYAAYRATFDNSKVARTASENRMKNIAVNYIIKAK